MLFPALLHIVSKVGGDASLYLCWLSKSAKITFIIKVISWGDYRLNANGQLTVMARWCVGRP